MIRKLIKPCFTTTKPFIVVVLFILLTTHVYLIGIPDDVGLLNIRFLDVGQGDSILIETPDDKTLLIDGGPDDSILNQLGEVWGNNNKSIDLLILSHPDSDHVNGLLLVLDKYEVKSIVSSKVDPTNSNYADFLQLVEQKQIELFEPNEFSDLMLGCCVYIDFMLPTAGRQFETTTKPNNISNAFELKYGKFNAFFGGDLDSEFEDFCLRKNPTNVDLLKVTHHGSLTSTSEEFLDRLRPDVAIISAGKNNKYGHPKPEIIDRLSQRSIKTYTTSQEGRIHIQTDGNKIWKVD